MSIIGILIVVFILCQFLRSGPTVLGFFLCLFGLGILIIAGLVCASMSAIYSATNFDDLVGPIALLVVLFTMLWNNQRNRKRAKANFVAQLVAIRDAKIAARFSHVQRNGDL